MFPTFVLKYLYDHNNAYIYVQKDYFADGSINMFEFASRVSIFVPYAYVCIVVIIFE